MGRQPVSARIDSRIVTFGSRARALGGVSASPCAWLPAMSQFAQETVEEEAEQEAGEADRSKTTSLLPVSAPRCNPHRTSRKTPIPSSTPSPPKTSARCPTVRWPKRCSASPASTSAVSRRPPTLTVSRSKAPASSFAACPIVRSELNGRDIFSATGGRSLSFNDVSPELRGPGRGVQEHHRRHDRRPALPALVNLVTRKPLDNPRLHIAGTIEANYGDLREEWSPDLQRSGFEHLRQRDRHLRPAACLFQVRTAEPHRCFAGCRSLLSQRRSDRAVACACSIVELRRLRRRPELHRRQLPACRFRHRSAVCGCAHHRSRP